MREFTNTRDIRFSLAKIGLPWSTKRLTWGIVRYNYFKEIDIYMQRTLTKETQGQLP